MAGASIGSVRRAGLVPALLLAMASPAVAQSPAPVAPAADAAGAIDAPRRRAVVVAFADAMRDRYVFPKVGEEVSRTLRAKLADGGYDALATAAALATQLSADAGAIAHDKHLRVWARGAGRRRGGGAQAPGTAGIVRADRLRGGWGYVEVAGFPEPATFRPAADAAMAALKGSRGLIFDLRGNLGGEPDAVAYLVSFLVPAGRPIDTIVSRVPGTDTFRREPFSSVATPVKFEGVPVYVLTSARTFSAGEAFAYDIQAMGRGRVIGEVTAGGANPTELVPLPNGVMATIPSERAENAVTKTNWEGRGVQPSVAVPADEALRAAMAAAGLVPAADLAAASIEQVFGAGTPQRR